MMKEFAVEVHHPLVFMPFNKNWVCFAASPLVMTHMSIGYKYDFPTPLTKAHAPVQVFTVHEITFIPWADIK